MKEIGPEQARQLITAGLRMHASGMFLLTLAQKLGGYGVRQKPIRPVIEVSARALPKQSEPNRQMKVPAPRSTPMPFGKYTGSPVAKLPDDYLKWAERQDWIRNPLKAVIREEAVYRKKLAEDGVVKALGIEHVLRDR